jgi:peroxiredoxin
VLEVVHVRYYTQVRRILPVLGVLLLSIAGGAGAETDAPGFKVRFIDGRGAFDSREAIGKKIIVLRFQASYCKPCATESTALNRLTERYRNRDVTVLAIHVQDTATDARSFARAHKTVYPIGLDPRLTLGNRFGFHGAPYTVVIDRKGEIAARITGEGAMRRLPRILDELIRAQPVNS